MSSNHIVGYNTQPMSAACIEAKVSSAWVLLGVAVVWAVGMAWASNVGLNKVNDMLKARAEATR
jgi:hypothetical protein